MSTRDSVGRQLTEAQQEYFKDSKVRDEEGRLLVMYHGTPNGGLTQFRNGSYYTQNPEYATVYQYPGASSLSVKPGASNPMNYEVYLNITKPFDIRNPNEREIFMKEYYRKYGTGAPLSESGLPDWTDGMDLQEFIEDMGDDYDGLILDEGATGGYGEAVKSRGLSYVTFSSEQVKRVDNPNPTSNPDIRYSGRDTDMSGGTAQKNTAEGGAKYSIVALSDGCVYVKASRNVITGNTKSDQRRNISEFFNSLLDGQPSLDIHTIEGDVLTISKAQTAKKARDDYKSVGGKSVKMTDTEFALKMHAEAHIDEIAEVSKSGNQRGDTKNHAFARSGFSYRRAYFEDFDGQYYEITLSIGNNGTQATVYNVGKMNKSVPPSAKIIAVVGSKALGGTLYGNSIRNPGEDVKPQMSTRDSAGRQLTEAHQDYFKDSKVSDKDGNLLVMYHGTPNGGYTRFRSGTYFTPSAEYATVYQSPGASSLSVKPGASNQMNYEVYLNITKPFDTRNPKEREIFTKEYYRKYGTGAPLSESGLPDWTDGMDLQEFIEDMGYDYDGLILGEGATGGYGEAVKSRGLSYVAFSSEQVKRVDNLSPTSDPDMRYSGRDNGGVEGYRKPAYERWDVEAALWDAMDHADRGDDNLIRVGEVPRFVEEILGIKGDFYIYRNHAYENMASRTDAEAAGRPVTRGGKNIHFHGLGVEKLADAIMSLDNPILTIEDSTEYGNPELVMILPVEGSNGTPLYAALSFYASIPVNGRFDIKPHVVLTIAEGSLHAVGGREGYVEIINNAIDEGRIISYDQKKMRANLSVIASHTRVGNITREALTRNIARAREKVKAFKLRSRITYSTRDPKTQHQLEQENESLREDVKYLREMLALQRKVTGGTKFTKTSVLAAARML